MNPAVTSQSHTAPGPSEKLARNLVDRAVSEEQVAHRIEAEDDIPQVRIAIRRLAREQHIRIRTAIIDGVLAVVRADAAIWNDPTPTMRAKLTPQ